MNKLLLTLFWLISLLIMFFIGKNMGAGDVSIAKEAQFDAIQNIESNPTKLESFDKKECQSAAELSKSSLPSSGLTNKNQTAQNSHTHDKQTLINELADVKRQLADAESQLESLNASKPNMPREDQPSQATEEEVSQHLSAPFDSVVLKARGSMVDKFRQLHEEPQDQEWSIVTEQHISDFFVTHDLADKVALDAITCKQTICEIRGFELENEAWGRIMSDMRAQPWWNFASSHSTTQNNKKFGMFFYSLVSKNVI
ncbi:hypothetical protein [Pseudoalteromonas phenolica]|uniref:Uncharacterized protein n=1 Tax=Pseudoalteromonas phenolica TaxID=161398 RepID=A0A0S2K2G6_9GAMM|nr:hypothetical protein [Pseudoalteromonas phenolica]ALO42695.1 hypothetical protein PP2015_2198 [Pseudoalteromonas phenolica]MBE0356198.1 hypothetical protein [Pseudoalteromonas phenolica O-BC30]